MPRGMAGAAVRPSDQPAPPQPKITLPKLVHFENAPYPPEAEKAGVQADVILKLSIDKEGKVTAAEVAEAAKQGGYGFDEAAVAAALKFTFEPATRDGKPIPAKILYRYSFTLTPVTPVTPGPAGTSAAAPKRGDLAGVVTIAGTDTPLAGADVAVSGGSLKERRLTTGIDGRWQLKDLPPGRYHVKVAASGFNGVDLDEEVVVGEATEVTYRLAPDSEGFEVTVRGERPPREVTRRTIERREMSRIPGTSGDALRSLQSLPGVARPPGLAGFLIVRGSAPQDTLTFVDGSNVPLVYHFGGLSSIIPTELLDRIDFYPGNFSAKYGRVMGGIVDIGLRKPNVRCYDAYAKPSDRTGCYHGMAQVDLIDLRLLVQGPVPLAKGWTFAAGARRSWIDTWLKPVLEEAGAGVTSAPVYYDYQLIAETEPTRDSRLSMRFYGSNDRLEILIKDPFANDPGFGGNITFETGFEQGQILYETKLDRDVDLTTMFSVGATTLSFGVGTFMFDLNFYPIQTRSEFGWKLGRGAKLNFGMDFLAAPFDVTVRAPPPPRPGEPNPGPFTTRPSRLTIDSGFGFRPSWYAEAELQPARRVRVVPGVRLDYARDSGHADFSPRINGRYDLVASTDSEEDEASARPKRLRTTLKGGVGLFHQPPQFQETDEVFGTPGLYSNRAVHYTLGVEQELSRQVELSVEGFYKDLTQVVSRQPDITGNFVYGNDGTGYAMGLETLLKYKPDKRFFGWLAYTLSRSIRQDGPDEQDYLFFFDQTHNLTVLGSYRLGRGWEFGARFRVISGPLATPVLDPPGLPALFAADAGAYTPLQGKPFSRRLPLFHQIDLRIDKHWQFASWRLSTYLDVQNAYNNAAVEAVVYNYNFTQETFQTGLPLIPSLGLRGEF